MSVIQIGTIFATSMARRQYCHKTIKKRYHTVMITEDYCSEEVSKLLSEKGFDEDTERVYERNIMACRYEDYPMPTHQMAMKWLRKKHNIIIVIEPHSYNLMEEKVSSYVFSIWCGDNYEDHLTINYPTFEETVEAALKYCLTELI